MNTVVKGLLGVVALVFSLGCGQQEGRQPELSDTQIDQYWQTGKTLPSSVVKRFPLPLQELQEDNGINVMIDLAHQCKFVTLWGLPHRLNQMGFRAVGSQAALHSVLDPKGESRIRIRWDEKKMIFPFAWHPNFSFNVIITHQSDLNAQKYLPEEQEALKQFVKDGGGLIIVGVPPANAKMAKNWSLNELCQQFGAQILAETDRVDDQDYAVISANDEWEIATQGTEGKPVGVIRSFGKGYVSILGKDAVFQVNREKEEETLAKNRILEKMVLSVSKGKEPVGGEPRYPISGGGGGGIYPELERHFNDVVLFYAANQKPELIKTVEEDLPEAKGLVEEWLPSQPTLEPMYLILSSGGGGGWAVNAFKPKENGIISLSPNGIVSIFAHELAHTMHGPVNQQGQVAGITPIPNRGEAHAGWFQGKIDAWFDASLLEEPVKKCNSLFEFDPTGDKLDLVTHYENKPLRDEFGKGKDWVKTWWIWQKLDDRYGPAWYPRWKWVQHTRWADDPQHQLSWEEMVEDMSIAVGEDLFPFLRAAGLSLETQRLPAIVFQGHELSLPIAPITVSKAGKVRLGKIGDYKKGLFFESVSRTRTQP